MARWDEGDWGPSVSRWGGLGSRGPLHTCGQVGAPSDEDRAKCMGLARACSGQVGSPLAKVRHSEMVGSGHYMVSLSRRWGKLWPGGGLPRG